MSSSADLATPRFLEKQTLDRLCLELHLSPREVDIVGALFSHSKEAGVADQLSMSPHTLRTHLERLYHKLQITNRTELVVRLYECFLSLTSKPDSPLPPICGRFASGVCQFAHCQQ